ncbi:DNA adenine methylase [Carboxylicivirga marina]|uniref:DNA adenine methylase n=1 Tax=Carboxylicivirga marina TaxID=2800988 RepID=UPI0025915B91|nr:DNA adenine methylase [uncultured Carboxylicivirga sp.]
MKKKTYSSAPMPFMGQKRRFLNQYKNALQDFSDAKVFVDLFGGSGLLSHTTKQVRPDATVVYNDFDDYHIRLLNVERTNSILQSIREIVKGYPDDKRLDQERKQKIIYYLKDQEKTGFVDYITLSSSLLFSMNYVLSIEELEKQSMYNCVRKSDYKTEGYLEGLHIVRNDYKVLFEQYKGIPGVVFIVDPPYLSTEVGTYKNYWRLSDYLDVLNVLKDSSYFYFTSDKSSIIELCEWLETNLDATNPFIDTVKYEMKVKVNHNAGYNDIMLYKNIDYQLSASGSLPAYESSTT